MELILAILGGGAGAAIVAGIFGVIQWKLNRKATKEDRVTAQQEKTCEARGQELQQLQQKVDVALLADRMILYDRIKHLAKSYIARGYITIEEQEDINMMHQVYHDPDKLDGNGFLDNLMHTVNHSLEVRAN